MKDPGHARAGRTSEDPLFPGYVFLVFLGGAASLAITLALATLALQKAPELTNSIGGGPADDFKIEQIPGEPNMTVRSRDGMFYVHATVNGHSTRFLVDTGATLTVLTQDDADAAGIQTDTNKPTTSIATINGKTHVQTDTIADLIVGNEHFINLPIVIMPNTGDPVVSTSLLGENALKKLGGITISGDVLTLGRPSTSRNAATNPF